MLILLASLYAVTSRDLDNLAHRSLKVASSNSIAMVSFVMLDLHAEDADSHKVFLKPQPCESWPH